MNISIYLNVSYHRKVHVDINISYIGYDVNVYTNLKTNRNGYDMITP